VNLMRKVRLQSLVFPLFLLTLACLTIFYRAAIKEAPVPAPGPPSLRSLAQSRGMYIGTAVNVDALQYEAQYKEILAREFNMVTPEVSMKFDATEPGLNLYNFAEGDVIVDFAKAHNMQVRGHNLVWYRALPSWLSAGTFSRDVLMGILRQHIITEV